jgi:F0F1-type ATP synthase alpha subunit
VTSGHFDNVPLEKIKPAEEALLVELKAKHAKLIEAINKGDKLTDAQNQQVLKVAQSIAKSYETADKPAAKPKEGEDA